jgi:hypothetical protein
LADKGNFVALSQSFAMRLKLIVFICLAILSVRETSAQMYVKQITADKLPMPYTGQVLEAREFRDALGLHYYVATDVKSDKMDSLFVRCYTKTGEGYVQDWQIRDFSPYGITYETWLKITDVNKDGIYETAFAYRVEGDVLNHGMLTIKLMLHYKNIKYAIRNVAHYGSDDDQVTMDKSFDTLPKSVKAFAINMWNNEISKGDMVKLIN